jgi:hypothetical protein
MRKKKWITLVLTVLVRGKPEENCLVGCKGSGGGPANSNSNCVQALMSCIYCSGLTFS